TTLTGNVALATAGGAVQFSGSTATVDGGFQLSITAGTAGDVSFDAAVGSTTRVGGVNIVSARNVTFSKAVSFAAQGIQVTSSGTTNFTQAVDSTAGGSMTVT